MDITNVGYEHPGWHSRCLSGSPVLARCILTNPWLSSLLHQGSIPSNCPVVVVMGENK